MTRKKVNPNPFETPRSSPRDSLDRVNYITYHRFWSNCLAWRELSNILLDLQAASSDLRLQYLEGFDFVPAFLIFSYAEIFDSYLYLFLSSRCNCKIHPSSLNLSFPYTTIRSKFFFTQLSPLKDWGLKDCHLRAANRATWADSRWIRPKRIETCAVESSGASTQVRIYLEVEPTSPGWDPFPTQAAPSDHNPSLRGLTVSIVMNI